MQTTFMFCMCHVLANVLPVHSAQITKSVTKTPNYFSFSVKHAELWSRSRDVPTSRLGLVSRKTVNVLVSAIYVSCPTPIFGQIVQASHSMQRERALDVVSIYIIYTVVTTAHHINTH